MRAELQHPEKSDLVAAYGWDRALSWWCEVRRAGRLVIEYDVISCGGPTTPAGILQVLIDQGFISEDDITEAREWLAEFEVDEIDDPGARRAAEVIVRLQEAGGSG